MKIENHLEAYKEHKETIFDWALKVKGIKGTLRSSSRDRVAEIAGFATFTPSLRKRR